MPYGTLELPCDMIAAAESYAQKERLSVVSFFGKLLNRQYGYAAAAIAEGVRRPVVVPDSVKAFSGVITLPEDKSDEELIREAVIEKYEEIS